MIGLFAFVLALVVGAALWIAAAALGIKSSVVQRYPQMTGVALRLVGLTAVPCLIAGVYSMWLGYAFAMVWCLCNGFSFGILSNDLNANRIKANSIEAVKVGWFSGTMVVFLGLVGLLTLVTTENAKEMLIQSGGFTICCLGQLVNAVLFMGLTNWQRQGGSAKPQKKDTAPSAEQLEEVRLVTSRLTTATEKWKTGFGRRCELEGLIEGVQQERTTLLKYRDLSAARFSGSEAEGYLTVTAKLLKTIEDETLPELEAQLAAFNASIAPDYEELCEAHKAGKASPFAEASWSVPGVEGLAMAVAVGEVFVEMGAAKDEVDSVETN